MALLDIHKQRGSKRIVLCQFIVDDEFQSELQRHIWTPSRKNYAQTFFTTPNGTKESKLLHHFIWELRHGSDSIPPGTLVDHLNKDLADNRLANLIFVDGSERSANSGLRSDNSTGYRGVQRARSGRFCARVRKDFKGMYFGTYDESIEAAYAVNLAFEALYPRLPAPNLIPANRLTPQNKLAIHQTVQGFLRT